MVEGLLLRLKKLNSPDRKALRERGAMKGSVDGIRKDAVHTSEQDLISERIAF